MKGSLGDKGYGKLWKNMDIWSHWVIQAVSFSIFWRLRFRNLSLGHRRIGTWSIIPGLVRSWDHPQIEAINFGHGWKGCLRTPGLGDVRTGSFYRVLGAHPPIGVSLTKVPGFPKSLEKGERIYQNFCQ